MSERAGMEGEALDDESEKMTAAEEAWDILKTVAIAVGITLFIRFFFVQPFNIPSGSMKPTLLVGDFILVDKIDYGYSRASLIYPLTRVPVPGRLFGDTPDRGEVVVFKNRNDANRDYIKRVIGLPGDTVELRRGTVLVNGEAATRAALPDEPDCAAFAPQARLYRETLPGGRAYVVQECMGDNHTWDTMPPRTVPDGHYFLMGDNRDNSMDSRTPTVEFVPDDMIVGRATRVAFSVDGGKSRLWEVWNWPRAIRYGRLGDEVE